MTERLGEVQERLATVAELREIVSAMRALAATRAQQGRAALDGTRAYAAIVGDALARATELLSPDGGSRYGATTARGVIVFCAEHGFAGAFSRRLLDAVGDVAREALLFVVGTRGLLSCRERGIEPTWSLPMATQTGAVAATTRRISEELFGRFAGGLLTGVDIVYARHLGGERSEIRRERLLPVEPTRGANRASLPPLINVPPADLVQRLLEEYFFAELTRAAIESFVSENAARLAAMQSARRNIDEKLDELRGAERRLRQEQVTAELLDVVTGAAAQNPDAASAG